MAYDNLNMDEITEARRKAIAETIQPISVEQLKVLGEGIFPYVDHPWRKAFFDFLEENAGAAFHYATTDDRIHVIYCPSKDKAIWFIPGSGTGILREKGLGMLKQIVDGAK